MGYNRPLCATDRALSRNSCGVVNSSKRRALELHFRLHAIPLVFNFCHRIVMVLP